MIILVNPHGVFARSWSRGLIPLPNSLIEPTMKVSMKLACGSLQIVILEYPNVSEFGPSN